MKPREVKAMRQKQVPDAPLSDVARREALYARIAVKRRRAPPVTLPVAPVSAPDSPTDPKTLLERAHSVLVRYVPHGALPLELAKVRALLDRHMFGRDGRSHRDDAVKVARQIDAAH
jgi:hypothetical protein